eukprot:TRINITY_DN204_c2_g1_i3.p1 TRINITY_DN204_c2_g1~~TRINITY_DN204_c2_g1_i3.p1  ORF type:complete len:278 (+),score=118.81 TRINITY_DN204_c2_g1_i3:500-1333(+)
MGGLFRKNAYDTDDENEDGDKENKEKNKKKKKKKKKKKETSFFLPTAKSDIKQAEFKRQEQEEHAKEGEEVGGPQLRKVELAYDDKRITLEKRISLPSPAEDDRPRGPFYSLKLEEATKLNLSYQDLGTEYQLDHLKKNILVDLKVSELIMTDNEIKDLHDIKLPTVERICLARNEFDSFSKLPRLNNCVELNLAGCKINTLNGMEKFKSVQSLVLRGNPVAERHDYMQMVAYHREKFKLDHLAFIDDEPVQDYDPEASDHEYYDPEEDSGSYCVIL